MNMDTPQPEQQALFEQLGRMTRTLHSTLSDLDPGRELERTVGAIPDARERLAYVLSMTEQAVSRVLNAVDDILPRQDHVRDEAQSLLKAWEQVGESADVAQRETAQRTRAFLQSLDEQSTFTRDRLMDIMMAQEFQDLTGQVIKKIVELANDMESQLLAILGSAATPVARPQPEGDGLLNGPAMPSAQPQTLNAQEDVDQFLASLGF